METKGDRSSEDDFADSDDENENSCVVCYDSMQTNNRSLVTLICGHRFHFACVGTYFNRIRKVECPYCRKVDPNCHWRLATIPLSEESEAESKFPENLEDTLGPIGCSICNSEFDPTIKPDVVLVGCGHKFHFDCLGEYCNHRNRVECPICHTLESGDMWHCPYGLHTSDVLEVSGINQAAILLPQHSAPTFLPTTSSLSSSEIESDETMGLLENEELSGEERLGNNQHHPEEDNEPTGCMSCSRRLLKKWFLAWTRGATGELRLMRLFVLIVVILAGDSAIRSSTLNNPKHNLLDQKELKDKLLILYVSSAIVPMLFCPGVLLLLPAILYVGLLLIKGYGHYYNSSLDMVLEPISSICCLFMMFYWIKCNRIALSNRDDGRRSRWRSLDEIYAG